MEQITLAVVQRAVAGNDGGVLCRQVQRRRDEAFPRRPIANRRRNQNLDATVVLPARYREARSAILKRPLGARTVKNLARLLVPRGGIEPPTRGFSVPCSTD